MDQRSSSKKVIILPIAVNIAITYIDTNRYHRFGKIFHICKLYLKAENIFAISFLMGKGAFHTVPYCHRFGKIFENYI